MLRATAVHRLVRLPDNLMTEDGQLGIVAVAVVAAFISATLIMVAEEEGVVALIVERPLALAAQRLVGREEEGGREEDQGEDNLKGKEFEG